MKSKTETEKKLVLTLSKDEVAQLYSAALTIINQGGTVTDLIGALGDFLNAA